MKLLFDQNPSFKLCQALTDLFPGSSQVRLLGLAEAAFEQDITAACLEIL
jgi:predicted nuclease of predicted toxin-antitoxin system